MSYICPVCKYQSFTESKCEICGFPKPNFTFLSEEDANNWYNKVVLSHREKLPMVASVIITPRSPSVVKGQTKRFEASVKGSGNPTQSVTWMVTGGRNGTRIDTNGLLTIAANESATRLEVIATSTLADNTSKNATTTVTVVGKKAKIAIVIGIPMMVVAILALVFCYLFLYKPDRDRVVIIQPTSQSDQPEQEVPAHTTTASKPESQPEPTVQQQSTPTSKTAQQPTKPQSVAETQPVSVSKSVSQPVQNQSAASEQTITATQPASPSTEIQSTPVTSIQTAFVPQVREQITITSITVKPLTATVNTGQSQKFTATVNGSGNPSQAVAWTITGNRSNKTYIDSKEGFLYVAADESVNSLTVIATSTVDPSRTVSVPVKVVPPEPEFPLDGTTWEFVDINNGGNRYILSYSGNVVTFQVLKGDLSDVVVLPKSGTYTLVGTRLTEHYKDSDEEYTYNRTNITNLHNPAIIYTPLR